MNGRKVKKLKKLHSVLNVDKPDEFFEINPANLKFKKHRKMKAIYNPNRAAWRRLKKEYRNKTVIAKEAA